MIASWLARIRHLVPAPASDLAFFDVEASGLHDGSFPIEIGWCVEDLEPQSFLIRPHASWTLEDWSFESEKIHGIPLELLHAEGLDPVDAWGRFLEATRGRILVSDAPSYDAAWLERLRRAIGGERPPGIADLSNIQGVAIKVAGHDPIEALRRIEHAEIVHPHPHRAGPDALRMAAAVKALLDDDYALEMRETAIRMMRRRLGRADDVH